MSTTSLYQPVTVGAWRLSNRVVMAPLTRNRAPGQTPTADMAVYYAQRAHPQDGAGLIISEATPISAQGHGYADTPGLHTYAQVAAWRQALQNAADAYRQGEGQPGSSQFKPYNVLNRLALEALLNG